MRDLTLKENIYNKKCLCQYRGGRGALTNTMGLCPALGDLNPLLRKGEGFHTALWSLNDNPQSTPSTGISTEKMDKYTILAQLNVFPPPIPPTSPRDYVPVDQPPPP